jgi:hypothetical protein
VCDNQIKCTVRQDNKQKLDFSMDSVSWRTRAYIESPAPLSTAEFRVGNYGVFSRPDLVADNSPKNLLIIDVILNGLDEPNAEEAHLIGIDTLEKFLDRLSLVSYAPCRLLKVISSCPVEVAENEPFKMVTEDLMQEIESPEVKPEHITPFNELPENSEVLLAVHLIRQALGAESVEQHLLHLHNAAERIALDETDDRIQNQCPKCEHIWDGPPASRRAVRRLLKERRVTRKDADDSMNYRGRIAHGGGQRNVAFNKRVTELAGAIEGATISTVANRAEVMVNRQSGIVVGRPITLHEARKEKDGSFVLLDTRWKAPIRFPKLDEDISVSGGKVLAGFPTRSDGQPNIDPAAWPS